MGVPYSDAWGMPVDMALDMLGISPTGSKSKQSGAANQHHPLPPSLVNQAPAAANNTARKLVAARRKSKTI